MVDSASAKARSESRAASGLKTLLQRFIEREGSSEIAQRFNKLLNGHDDPTLRTTYPGHLTASAWVMRADLGAVLLLHHKKLNCWLQPGGHADGSFDLVEVARKEVLEETGVGELEPREPEIFDLDIHEIPPFGTTPAHLHFDVRFAFIAPAEAIITSNNESSAVRWFTLDAIEQLNVDQSIIRMKNRWLGDLTCRYQATQRPANSQCLNQKRAVESV